VTQPSGRLAEPDDPRSVSERTRRLVEAEHRRREAAAEAARRRDRSTLGRLVRGVRWLRNRRTGPLPRLRRMGGVLRDAAREPRRIRALPADLATAALAPVRVRGASGAPPPRRTWEPERDAAHRRLSRAGRGPLELAALADLRVAAIADEGLAGLLRGACETLFVRPEDWRADLESRPPHLLLVESARRGNGGAWQYRIAWHAHPDALLRRDLGALVGWCATRDVPCVFWDTVGVPGTDRFVDAAASFDLVAAPDAVAAARHRDHPDRRGAGVVVLPPPVESDGARANLRRLAATAGIRIAGEPYEPLEVEPVAVAATVPGTAA
jgi:hypothetical protein